MVGSNNVPEKYSLIFEAAKNSSEANFEGIAAATHADGIRLTWQFSGDPQLGQATFGFMSSTVVFNAKFDGTKPLGLSVFDISASKNRYVELDYTYAADKFSVFIPYELLDLDGVEVKFDMAVNSVRRGEVTVVL
ncbi:hypothetical protein [Corynebacterium singulare]|uniref:Uncharacterized protein n=1 Tax=Corynebacterium singulare TaxID=161899 RepID=A0ABS9PTN4_9CORY|nr:hypothetical protein [Corynebacterium singulare]MCG7276073.1 hypothetical protein [Corynebacterium singulare]